MKISIPQNVNTALHLLEKAGFSAYLVGGCVRDALMGRKTCDYDIATNAKPDEMRRVFAEHKTVDTGIKHGTLTVICENEPLEITAFRTESDYGDMRRPDSVCFVDSLEEDLKRRDFTVNALAYSEKSGLIDLFGGADDIKNCVLKTVGEPEKRFSEDALRIMRALRFSSVLNFEIEEKTAKALHDCRFLLEKISKERIFSELKKMLCGENIFSVLMNFPDVLSVIIPEIAPCVGFCQHTPWHIYDVWEHIARSVSEIKPENPGRLVMLLHDLGKPPCFTQDENGRGHFYNHGQKSAEIAEKTLRSLKAPADEINQAVTLVKYHDANLFATEKSTKRWLLKLGEKNLLTLCDIHEADNRAQNPDMTERMTEAAKMRKQIKRIVLSNALVDEKKLALDGNDIAALGAKGSEIGAIKRELLLAIIDEKCANEKNALLAFAERELLKMRKKGAKI